MTNYRTPLALLALAGLGLAACGGGDDDATATTAETVETTPESTTPETTEPAPSTIDESTTTSSTIEPITITTVPDIPRVPLTGEPLEGDAEIPDRPAMVVKIPNNSAAIPQNGLNRADIVYATVINDASTRFLAVFHTQDVETLGPIRSGRATDVHIAEAFNTPLFVWSGGNPGVTRLIRDADVVDLNMTRTPGYYRRSGRSAPHNLYTSTETMWAQTPDDAEPPTPVFPYLREGDVIEGEEATVVEVTLDGTDARWEYDPETNRYMRWQNGSEHNTEEYGQIWTDNLVVLMTDYSRSPIDGRVPYGHTLGSNPVYVFADGVVREGVWLRFQPADPWALLDNLDDLNEIPLRPGRTWVEMPRSGDDVSEVLVWE